MEFIYKKCVFILTHLKFSHLQRTLHLMQCTYRDIYSTAQNRFWTCWFWCLLVLLLFFTSPLSHWQNISLWGLFSNREINEKKVTRGKIRWIWRVGHRGYAGLGKKLMNTQRGVGRCTRKSPTVKWANVLNLQKKKSLRQNAASHNNTSWYTDTDGFLEHSPSRGSLYYKGPALHNIIPFLGVPPLIYKSWEL